MGLGVVDLNTTPGLFCITGGPYCIGFPDSLAFDKSGNLWVSDDTNGRVLEFPQPFSTNESASMVVGQPNFTSISPVAGPSGFNVSQSDMYGNDGVAIDSNGEPLGERWSGQQGPGVLCIGCGKFIVDIPGFQFLFFLDGCRLFRLPDDGEPFSKLIATVDGALHEDRNLDDDHRRRPIEF